MKQIKFIAAAAILVSTSMVSSESVNETELAPSAGIVCPEWPYCRGVDFAEQLQTEETVVAETSRAKSV